MIAPAPGRPGNSDRIVVAVDFSAPSIAAAEWITQHVARGKEVVLVHVLDARSFPSFLTGRDPRANGDRLMDSARLGALARLRELSASIATGLVWPEVRVGRPDEEIVRAAKEYDAGLVVVGRPATRVGLLGRIGTTAQRVLRRSPVPVLLAAGMADRAPSRLLAAVDDSAMADVVVASARELADRFTAEAAVIHVVSIPVFNGASTATTGRGLIAPEEARYGPATDERVVRDAERRLARRLELAGDGGRIAASVVAGHVRPAEAILEEARRRSAELIVVGSRSSGAVPRLLSGSVAETVLRGASRPVLVIVPPPVARRVRASASAAMRSSNAGPGPASAATDHLMTSVIGDFD